jgi:hypothetical protein
LPRRLDTSGDGTNRHFSSRPAFWREEIAPSRGPLNRALRLADHEDGLRKESSCATDPVERIARADINKEPES